MNQWWRRNFLAAWIRGERQMKRNIHYCTFGFAALGCLVLAGAACRQRPERAPQPNAKELSNPKGLTFTPVAQQAGITHRHYQPILDSKINNIMAWMASVGAAAAAGDFDNDGWIDLFCTNSRKGQPNYLYRNNHDGTFTDVARRAGLADANDDARGTSMDCVWGDFDNDGWIDLYLVRWGVDSLYHNNGDGTFTDVSKKYFTRPDGTPGLPWANGNAVIWLDYNNDGRLDLYVGNYFLPHDLWHLTTTRIMHGDFEQARDGGRNYFYVQTADGRFVERAAELGLDDPGWTLALGAGDMNNDGWVDIYAANDFGPDQLFINNKDGTFTNSSDVSIIPDTKKGMNADFGDFDNDGWLDIFVANITTTEYLQEGNMLWHNEGPDEDGLPLFLDVSLETGTYNGGWGWGAKFLDYDNDGDLDIYAVNGFISQGEGSYWYDLASWTVLSPDTGDAANWPPIGDRSFSGYEPARLWRNDGLAAFVETAEALNLADKRDGRGVVCFDYDNDGDLDIFVANQNAPPELFRNDGGNRNNWLAVALVPDPGTGSNRDGLGTRVTVVTDSGMQIRERDGGNGYCGQSDPRLYVGLGDEDKARLVEIRWPSGGLQYLEEVPANKIVTVREDPARFAEASGMNVPPPTPWGKPAEEDSNKPGVPPEVVDQLLTDLEQRFPEDFTNAYEHAFLYRSRCIEYGQHERAIKFFESLVEADPNDLNKRLELSAAYVDKIPTCGGIAAVVSKGQLATKALDQLKAALKQSPDWWPGLYASSMNHLHWPRALRHTPHAIKHLKHCLQIQSASGDPAGRPYYVRTHILIGDAYAKNGDHDAARKAWRRGLELFPDNPELKKRLAISDGDLPAFIKNQYNLEQQIDTDFSFLSGYE
jgi:hypothetical protein